MKILHFIIYFKFINHSLHFYIKKNYFLKTNHVEQRGFAVGNEVSNLYTSDTMITRGEWGLIRIHIVLYSCIHASENNPNHAHMKRPLSVQEKQCLYKFFPSCINHVLVLKYNFLMNWPNAISKQSWEEAGWRIWENFSSIIGAFLCQRWLFCPKS